MPYLARYRLWIVLLAAALLAACSNNATAQLQPTMDPSMPGMNHSAVSQTPSPVFQHTAVPQPTMDPSMPGMNHAPNPQTTATVGMPGMESGGHDMNAIDISAATPALTDARGDQLLEPTLADGVKEFALTTSLITWPILPDVRVAAYAYNEQVPGPRIRVQVGDRIRIRVTNNLAESTSVHWHGLNIPNDQDGAAEVTQPPIAPGTTYTYAYTVPDTPGTFFYHTHSAGDRQQALGLYGAFIIDDPAATSAADQEYTIQLGEWRMMNGQTMPAMELEGMLPNYFTINGKSFPATETINARVGERLLIRFIGSGQFIHPMHIHGGSFEIVATDGNPVPAAARLKKDTVLIGPGERYDVVWAAPRPDKWLIHCHIAHHITNDGAEVGGGGGLTMVINVTE